MGRRFNLPPEASLLPQALGRGDTCHPRWPEYPRRVQTRYLIIAALVTAMTILGASLTWLLIGVL